VVQVVARLIFSCARTGVSDKSEVRGPSGVDHLTSGR